MVQQLDTIDLTYLYQKLKPIFEDGSITFTRDKHPELYEELVNMGTKLGFEFKTINVNRNFQSQPHKDGSAIGMSYVISCGEYTGGELVIEGTEYNAYHRPTFFEGTKLLHWNNPIIGDKFSIVYWTWLNDVKVQQLDPYDLSAIYEKLKQLNINKSSQTLQPDFPLYEELMAIGKGFGCFGFEFDSIQLVHNCALPRHKDKGVKSRSLCISCGNYLGGELVIEGTEYNTYHKPTIFDGVHCFHWNKPIQGDKYSIVYWIKA